MASAPTKKQVRQTTLLSFTKANVSAPLVSESDLMPADHSVPENFKPNEESQELPLEYVSISTSTSPKSPTSITSPTSQPDYDISTACSSSTNVPITKSIVSTTSSAVLVMTDLNNDKPFRPAKNDYPPTVFGKKKRKFNSTWFMGRPWLEYSLVTNSTFCFACRVFGQPSQRDIDQAFVSKGFSNWKTALEDGRGFSQHENANSHVEAMLRWKEYRLRLEGGSCIESQLCGEQIQRNRYFIRSIAEVIQFLAVNELSFRGDNEQEQELDLNDESNFGGLFLKLFDFTMMKDQRLRQIANGMPKNAKYTSPAIQNEIISSLASMVQEKVVEEFLNSDIRRFCLKCDETRDACNVENLSIVLRFVNAGIPKEHLLTVVELGDVDAKSITAAIIGALRLHGVDPKAILSQCYDGASVMSGTKGGVRKFIQDEVGWEVPYVHCFNHQLHLVVISVMQKEPEARSFFSICEQLYVFLRRQLPSTLYQGTTVKRLLEQRWTGHLDSAKIVVSNRSEIMDALLAVSESPKAAGNLSVEAAGLRAKVKQSQFAAVGEMVVRILSILQPANSMLQSRTCNMSDAMELLEHGIACLESLRNEEVFHSIAVKTALVAEAECENPVQDAQEPRPKRAKTQSTLLKNAVVFTTLGQDSAPMGKASRPSQCAHMQRVFFSLLDQVVGELKVRFSGKNQGVVSAVSALLPRSTSFLDAALLQPLAELARVDSGLTQGEIAVARPFLLKTLASDCTLQEALVVVNKFREAFPMVATLYSAAVTIGVSSSTCENTFSTLTRVLRPQRRAMSHQRKSALVILAYEKKITRSLDLDKFLDIFAKQSRRITL